MEIFVGEQLDIKIKHNQQRRREKCINHSARLYTPIYLRKKVNVAIKPTRALFILQSLFLSTKQVKLSIFQ